MDAKTAKLVASFQKRSQETLQEHKERASTHLSSVLSVGCTTASLSAAKDNDVFAQHLEMSNGIQNKHLELAQLRLAELKKINAKNGTTNRSSREEKRDTDQRRAQPKKKTNQNQKMSKHHEEDATDEEEKSEEHQFKLM